MKIILNITLARIPFIFWAISFFVQIIPKLILSINSLIWRENKKDSLICIEAGQKGWESIELKELFSSATEYLSAEKVKQNIVDKEKSYLIQVYKTITKHKPTHYVYDPRTGSQNWIIGTSQSLILGLLFVLFRITPIVILTDFSYRFWRSQSAVITSTTGLVVTLMSPKRVSSIFPHTRIIGPSLMPFSKKTLGMINDLKIKKIKRAKPKAYFYGSLYEPRTQTLLEIKNLLIKKGFDLEIKGTNIGDPKKPELEYWKNLIDADIIVTTASQMSQAGIDWSHIPHFIYRYLEVLACETLLFAEKVDGLEKFFTPGKHLITFSCPNEAAERISHYLSNPEEIIKISDSGNKQAKNLINGSLFWLMIDSNLRKDSIY